MKNKVLLRSVVIFVSSFLTIFILRFLLPEIENVFLDVLIKCSILTVVLVLIFHFCKQKM